MPFCTNSLTPESKSRPVNRSLSEAQLVGDARRGRPEAFEALWQALTPRLYKTAFRITRNVEDAEDAVQNSLLSACGCVRTQPSPPGEDGKESFWFNVVEDITDRKRMEDELRLQIVRLRETETRLQTFFETARTWFS
jgi:PAS domain-containing protein